MIFAVDFDGTCVDHQFPALGPDVPHAVESLRKLVSNGHQIILWTMRSDEPLEHAVNWFTHNGIPLFGVNANPEQHWSNSPKAYANFYIDDAAVGCPLLDPIAPGGRMRVDWLGVMALIEAKQGVLSGH